MYTSMFLCCKREGSPPRWSTHVEKLGGALDEVIYYVVCTIDIVRTLATGYDHDYALTPPTNYYYLCMVSAQECKEIGSAPLE